MRAMSANVPTQSAGRAMLAPTSKPSDSGRWKAPTVVRENNAVHTKVCQIMPRISVGPKRRLQHDAEAQHQLQNHDLQVRTGENDRCECYCNHAEKYYNAPPVPLGLKLEDEEVEKKKYVSASGVVGLALGPQTPAREDAIRKECSAIHK